MRGRRTRVAIGTALRLGRHRPAHTAVEKIRNSSRKGSPGPRLRAYAPGVPTEAVRSGREKSAGEKSAPEKSARGQSAREQSASRKTAPRKSAPRRGAARATGSADTTAAKRGDAPGPREPADAPERARPGGRRHRSRQRDRILAWLRGSEAHPTAAQIHDALLPEIPRLSLGTVYRNLEVLVAEGEVAEVLAAGRPARYDANRTPHQHFCCDGCGRIVDVAMPAPRGLSARLAREHGLIARRVHVTFRGLCSACERGAAKERSGPPSSG